jgi:hypothetical protein
VKACVFLGPTLPIEEARPRLPDSVFRPPVTAGDVYQAFRDGFTSIGIIDGLFEQAPTVWHKEILFALSGGARVYGAASMGALRAADLHPFGMIGVGAIFDAYRTGELEDDDEVAVCHGDADSGFRPLSDAMVSIRFGLRYAERAGLISRSFAEALVARAKRTFYPDRSWKALLLDGRALDVEHAELQRLESWLASAHPNQKRDDALLLLERMAADADLPAPANDPVFEPTFFWDRMVRSLDRPAVSAEGNERG